MRSQSHGRCSVQSLLPPLANANGSSLLLRASDSLGASTSIMAASSLVSITPPSATNATLLLNDALSKLPTANLSREAFGETVALAGMATAGLRVNATSTIKDQNATAELQVIALAQHHQASLKRQLKYHVWAV